jgi:hypothetical protein
MSSGVEDGTCSADYCSRDDESFFAFGLEGFLYFGLNDGTFASISSTSRNSSSIMETFSLGFA